MPRRGGWHYEFGWTIALQRKDGSWTVEDAATYEEAKEIRDDAIATQDYEQAWIRMRNT